MYSQHVDEKSVLRFHDVCGSVLNCSRLTVPSVFSARAMKWLHARACCLTSSCSGRRVVVLHANPLPASRVWNITLF
jgi:hypothetical protein